MKPRLSGPSGGAQPAKPEECTCIQSIYAGVSQLFPEIFMLMSRPSAVLNNYHCSLLRLNQHQS